MDDIIEIDTDEHFGRTNTGKKQAPTPKVVEVKEEKVAEEEPKESNLAEVDEDMLYDLC